MVAGGALLQGGGNCNCTGRGSIGRIRNGSIGRTDRREATRGSTSEVVSTASAAHVQALEKTHVLNIQKSLLVLKAASGSIGSSGCIGTLNPAWPGRWHRRLGVASAATRARAATICGGRRPQRFTGPLRGAGPPEPGKLKLTVGRTPPPSKNYSKETPGLLPPKSI